MSNDCRLETFPKIWDLILQSLRLTYGAILPEDLIHLGRKNEIDRPF